jgi:hypothetical protein
MKHLLNWVEIPVSVLERAKAFYSAILDMQMEELENLSTILNKVEDSGGSILMPKLFLSDMAGYIALFTDSEGNRIGLQSMT